MSLISKIICFVVLLCSFLLILATGSTNIRNFERVQESIEGIYKDRLVVKGLIFELSSMLHKKELAIVSNDLSFYSKKNSDTNVKIKETLSAFRETVLTQKEEKTLALFSKGIKKLQSKEDEIGLAKGDALAAVDKTELKKQIGNLKKDLIVLAGIQLKEGQQKLQTGSYAVERMNEFANLENYVLVLIGLMMLAIVFIPGPGDDLVWSSKSNSNSSSDKKI